MFVAFAGEYFIYEPNLLYRFDRADVPWIYPGREKDWDGTELFQTWNDPRVVYRADTGKLEDLMTTENF